MVFSHGWQLPLSGGMRLYSGAALTLLGRRARPASAHIASARRIRGVLDSLPLARLFIAGIVSRVRSPNQALEPTPLLSRLVLRTSRASHSRGSSLTLGKR